MIFFFILLEVGLAYFGYLFRDAVKLFFISFSLLFNFYFNTFMCLALIVIYPIKGIYDLIHSLKTKFCIFNIIYLSCCIIGLCNLFLLLFNIVILREVRFQFLLIYAITICVQHICGLKKIIFYIYYFMLIPSNSNEELQFQDWLWDNITDYFLKIALFELLLFFYFFFIEKIYLCYFITIWFPFLLYFGIIIHYLYVLYYNQSFFATYVGDDLLKLKNFNGFSIKKKN